MILNKHLIVNSKGQCRLRNDEPNLDWNEIAIKLNMSIPDALFEKPRLQATIAIPETAANTEPLSAEVIDNCEKAMREATGMLVKVELVRKNEPSTDNTPTDQNL